MSFVFYNGKFLEENQPLFDARHRGLRYGDGLFETIKFKNNRLILIDEHLERLWQGAHMMKFQLPKLLSKTSIVQDILATIHKNKLKQARVRIAFYRTNGGLYDAIHHHPDLVIEALPLNENNGMLNENGLQCCLYEDSRKICDAFSQYKHSNFLPYLMGALFAKEQKCNDAIIFNQFGHICDTTIANIFFIKDQQIFTPAIHEGCVAGIMRSFIIKQLHFLGYSIHETAVHVEQLKDADEVFLTNSIYNIRWVSNIGDKSYGCSMIRKIYTDLQQTNSDVFC